MISDPDQFPRRHSSRHVFIFGVIALLHVLFILGPLGMRALFDKISPPKENIYRVKLGGRELSTSPEVGPPERTRPRPAEPTPAAPPPQPEPQPEAAPQPVEPRPQLPKPQPKPKKKTKPKPKPKTKPRETAKQRREKQRKKELARQKWLAKQKKIKEEKRRKELARQKWLEKVERRKKLAAERRRKELESQVYRPPAGNNFNPNVPIGSHDRGQQRGKADHRTPGGGATIAMEKFQKNLISYLRYRWSAPSTFQLDNRNASVLIELSVASDGRVLNSRITRPSGIAVLDHSVKMLLSKLDRVPRPPERAIRFEVELRPEN